MKLTAGVVAHVPVKLIKPDPDQPRKTFDDKALASLSESIKHGIEVPLTVRLDKGAIVIVDGERRWRAAKLPKLEKLPCLLSERNDQLEIAGTQLTTAAQREGLAPLDIGEFLLELRTKRKRSTNELMADLSKIGIRE